MINLAGHTYPFDQPTLSSVSVTWDRHISALIYLLDMTDGHSVIPNLFEQRQIRNQMQGLLLHLKMGGRLLFNM